MAPPILRFQALEPQAAQMLSYCQTNECGAIDAGVLRGVVYGPKQLSVQYDLDRFHTVEHTSQQPRRSRPSGAVGADSLRT